VESGEWRVGSVIEIVINNRPLTLLAR